MEQAKRIKEAARGAYEALAPAYDDFTGTLDYEPWLAEVLPRLERYDLAGQHLLDVGCGTGKSLIPMLERGWRVTGCDISPAMIKAAQDKIGDAARLAVADMRDLPPLGDFDLVWSLNDSVNYLSDPDELEAALSAMRQNLGNGGLLVFDVNTLLTYRTFFTERCVVEVGGRRLIWSGRAASNQAPSSVCEAIFEVEEEDSEAESVGHIHRQRHFPEAEVLDAIKRANLECLEVFGQSDSGALHQPLDESEHVKALYIARTQRADQ